MICCVFQSGRTIQIDGVLGDPEAGDDVAGRGADGGVAQHHRLRMPGLAGRPGKARKIACRAGRGKLVARQRQQGFIV